MNTLTRASLLLGALALAGCAQTNSVTRNSGDALTFHHDVTSDVLPAEQAAALKAQSRKIVQGTTLRGAMVGAAVGCGVGVVTGNSSKCLASAALGAAGGALIGNAQGRKQVAQRMVLAGSTDLARDIRAADAQLTALNASLPAHLATQDAQLRRDRAALAAGRIDQFEFDSRLNTIRRDRAALAEALSLTSRQSRAAARNMAQASKDGQTGLEWHIKRTGQIADQATSARSTISLL